MTHYAHAAQDRVRALREALPLLPLSTSVADRIAVARDGGPPRRSERGDALAPKDLPAGVCWPESEADVVALIRAARRIGLPLVPMGGGTSLAQAPHLPPGALVVDLKRFDQIVAIRREDHWVRVQAGVLGVHLEEKLRAAGLTLGHEPASFTSATVGGALASRSAGVRSFGRGDIESRALSLRVVTGRGEVVETGRAVGPGPGPDWTRLFLGSEGTLGVILEATLRVSPVPETQRWATYGFRHFEAGLEAIRLLAQSDLPIAVLRLHDPNASLLLRGALGRQDKAPHGLFRFLPDSQRDSRLASRIGSAALRLALHHASGANWTLAQLSGHLGREGALLVVGYEGPPDVVAASARLAHGLLLHAGARDLGPELATRWYRRHFSMGFDLARLARAGLQVDHLDASVCWRRLAELHHAVSRAATPHALVLAQLTHAYPTGAGLLYTFLRTAETRPARGAGDEQLLPATLRAVVRSGGSIGHHLGMGRVNAGFVLQELGTSMSLGEALKASLDPDGILNPGVMERS